MADPFRLRIRSVRLSGQAAFYGSRSGRSVHARNSAPCCPYPVCEKFRCRPLAGSNVAYQGTRASRCHPVRSAVAAHRSPDVRRRGMPQTGWLQSRRPGADRRRAEGCPLPLVDRLLPAGGRHPRLWGEEEGGIGGGCLPLHIIHLIAIGKRRLHLEANSSRTGPVPGCCRRARERRSLDRKTRRAMDRPGPSPGRSIAAVFHSANVHAAPKDSG